MSDQAMSPLRLRMIEDDPIARSHRRFNNVTSAPPTVRMTKPVQLEMQ